MKRALKTLGGASLLAIAATAAATQPVAAQEGPEGGVYSSYYALGDSYSSGVGTSIMNNDACLTSSMAWPYRVEADIGAPPFADVACSGATTVDIMAEGPKFAAQGMQAQIAALPPAEQLNGALITIQIGGNDIGIDELFGECIFGSKNPDGTRGEIPASCADLAGRYNNATDTIRNLAPSLDYIYRGLAAAAPNATIVAVGYPHTVSTTNPDCDSTLTGATLSQDKRVMLNSLIDVGNAQIKESAVNAGISAITDEIATAFDGHEACSKDEWIVSPEAAGLEGVKIGHPTDIGAQTIAEVVLTLLPSLPTRNGAVISGEEQDSGGEVGEPGPADGDEGAAGGGDEP